MTNLHDYELKSILFEWRLARVTLTFDRWQASNVTLVAEGVIALHVPKRQEWGPSSFVNECIGPSNEEGGLQALSVEMQSGDILKIVARTFDFPPDPPADQPSDPRNLPLGRSR